MDQSTMGGWTGEPVSPAEGTAIQTPEQGAATTRLSLHTPTTITKVSTPLLMRALGPGW